MFGFPYFRPYFGPYLGFPYFGFPYFWPYIGLVLGSIYSVGVPSSAGVRFCPKVLFGK